MFSVCVPAWNESPKTIEHITANVMQSSLWEKSAEKELIICLNGVKYPSTDAAVIMANELAQIHPNIKVLVLEDKGRNLALNEMVKSSNPSSKTLFFVDSDIDLQNDTLSELRMALDMEPEIAVAAAKGFFIQEKTGKMEVFRRVAMRSKQAKLEVEQQGIRGGCFAIRKSVAKEAGFPKDERICDDTYLTIRLEGRFRVVNSAVFYSRAPSLATWIKTARRSYISNILIKKQFPELKAAVERNIAHSVKKTTTHLQKGTGLNRVANAAVSSMLENYIRATSYLAVVTGKNTWPKKPPKRPEHML